jgi:hypothetical protein
MAHRPYFKVGIDQLQFLFDGANGDQRLLQALKQELQHRKMPKAKALGKKVDDELKVLFYQPTVPSLAPAPLPPPAAPQRIAVECAHCQTAHFVSTLDGVRQSLSCPCCKASYEAVFRYGVMRTKFQSKPTAASQPGIAGWIALGIFALVALLLLVK